MTLEPKFIAALDDLSLVARTLVEGFLSGQHRSPFLGYSSEFASYRPYMQGDNLRHVDWKVWGRTDTLYVKQFEDDTNMYGQILLDTSASMDFGNPAKFPYATVLAAGLAYLMTKQHDAPGLTLFGDGAIRVLPARGHREQLDDVLHALARARASGRTRIGSELRAVVETFPGAVWRWSFRICCPRTTRCSSCSGSCISSGRRGSCSRCWRRRNWTSTTMGTTWSRIARPEWKCRCTPGHFGTSIVAAWVTTANA
jgi:uncharacterized protein (DUF58 family)